MAGFIHSTPFAWGERNYRKTAMREIELLEFMILDIVHGNVVQDLNWKLKGEIRSHAQKEIYSVYDPKKYKRRHSFLNSYNYDYRIEDINDSSFRFVFHSENIKANYNSSYQLTPLVAGGQDWAIKNNYPVKYKNFYSSDGKLDYEKHPYYKPRNPFASLKRDGDTLKTLTKKTVKTAFDRAYNNFDIRG